MLNNYFKTIEQSSHDWVLQSETVLWLVRLFFFVLFCSPPVSLKLRLVHLYSIALCMHTQKSHYSGSPPALSFLPPSQTHWQVHVPWQSTWRNGWLNERPPLPLPCTVTFGAEGELVAGSSGHQVCLQRERGEPIQWMSSVTLDMW